MAHFTGEEVPGSLHSVDPLKIKERPGETEAGVSGIQGQPLLHREIRASLGYKEIRLKQVEDHLKVTHMLWTAHSDTASLLFCTLDHVRPQPTQPAISSTDLSSMEPQLIPKSIV